MSKWMTRKAINEGPGDAGKVKMATAIMNISRLSCSGPLSGALCRGSLRMGLHKGQGNGECLALRSLVLYHRSNSRGVETAAAAPATVALFKETSQNPVLLDAVGAIFSQWRVPALPQLPPSARVLKTLWQRLPKYSGIEKGEALYETCAGGAAGDEGKARSCLSQWAVRREALVTQLKRVKDALDYHFPTNSGYSGSYWVRNQACNQQLCSARTHDSY